jgi:hypothetical protein
MATSKSTFRFFDIPKDIRFEIYEYLPERTLRPILPDSHGLWYEDTKPPTALLLANRFMYHEVKDFFEKRRLSEPASIITRDQHCLCVVYFVNAIELGHKYGVSHQRNNPKAEITDALDRITQAVSIRMFKNDIAGRLSKDFKWSDVTTLVSFDESVLKETCHLSISKMRRRQRMKVRFITSDGSLSELRLRRLISGKSGPRTDIKLEITIAPEPKIQEKIINYQFVRLGQATTLEFQRFQWEILPTKMLNVCGVRKKSRFVSDQRWREVLHFRSMWSCSVSTSELVNQCISNTIKYFGSLLQSSEERFAEVSGICYLWITVIQTPCSSAYSKTFE